MHRTSDGVYRATALDALPWLRHGFGTRHFGPLDCPVATLRQIHSARVFRAAGQTGILVEGDALIDNTPGILLGVKTADCFPVLLADSKTRAVAAVHAGWRGTAARIVPAAIAAMTEAFGTNPLDLHAAIGPGIGPCCFEVGPETAFELVGLRERTHVDLAELNQQQLISSQVPEQNISSAGLCTVCRADEFFSYRRERESAGRMITFIGIAAGSPGQ